jgi:hypothetical protein
MTKNHENVIYEYLNGLFFTEISVKIISLCALIWMSLQVKLLIMDQSVVVINNRPFGVST